MSAITLYPSLHISEGNVARLTRKADDLEEIEILHDDPAKRAADFEAQNFSWLHVVDIDGAFQGRLVNVASIENILKNVKIPIQLSGGIRDMKTIEEWFNKDIARIVLTSAAVQDPELVRTACRAFPGRIGVKIDSRDGYVTTTGWTKTSSMKALDLALRVEEAGAAVVIYADINRDGALSEVNIEAIIDFAFSLNTPVIASGGVNSMQDLKDLKANAKTGIAGLILGGALYSGKIKADEALAVAAA